MTLACLSCGSLHTRVVRTRQESGGLRWRRVRCHDCSAMSDYANDKPRDTAAPRRPTSHRYRFSDRTLIRILMQREPTSLLARELGCSHELIRQIRAGQVHKTRVPEVPRWDGAKPLSSEFSCCVCRHWEGDGCGMGFPDPETEGPAFARDCSLYEVQR